MTNKMKICCFYSNICTCRMDDWYPIINRVQCHNGPQWQALFNSEMNVHFPLKLGIYWLDERLSAFQEPCSTGKLSTAFILNCKHSTCSAKIIITLQSTDVPHVNMVDTNELWDKHAALNFKAQKIAASSEETLTVKGWMFPLVMLSHIPHWAPSHM